ncbi:LOW QUALITY PROTEIN: K(+) efflux antiporter 2, chloroplastic [Asparagus officinalis]|uniref:LOW QUALITY PROTEIN: K(+) efflux antiporter 2, chloroplastic n=1 Tax=Asparagus officinalis TaxID=4686 RepID=UPI00098E5558|nr:LOW QUALITY PROTEIN: K(+) efflux antiporter 2, chloroplastic [Asparagus officinalis]
MSFSTDIRRRKRQVTLSDLKRFIRIEDEIRTRTKNELLAKQKASANMVATNSEKSDNSVVNEVSSSAFSSVLWHNRLGHVNYRKLSSMEKLRLLPKYRGNKPDKCELLFSNFPVIIASLSLLIGGKAILVALIGRIFGISSIAAIRVGLLLAPGEFAFVAFGEAVNQLYLSSSAFFGIMSPQLSSLLFLVVGISMAVTPWLAAGGQFLASRFEQHDVRNMLPVETRECETDDLQDHIIICGFGRVGQIIAQLLSERLIPFVALDVRSDRVAAGRAFDLPVYFGDAGSQEVLHKVGSERACAAAITLDTPGANYRTVWALNKYFPNVKTFVRAHDVDHGINLEKAGATAVVPDTLEPSLQLAAAVLAQVKMKLATAVAMSEIAATINEFRSRHLSELTETSGGPLGYGYSRVTSKSETPISGEEDDVVEGALAI